MPQACRKSFATIANYFPLPKNIIIDVFLVFRKGNGNLFGNKNKQKGVRHKIGIGALLLYKVWDIVSLIILHICLNHIFIRIILCFWYSKASLV